MDDASLKEKLCMSLCQYYKPTKDNALACMGFLVADHFVRKGRQFSFQKPVLTPDIESDRTLINFICMKCPFYEGDCDFILGTQKALPCGGLMLIKYLYDSRIISLDDLDEIEELQ